MKLPSARILLAVFVALLAVGTVGCTRREPTKSSSRNAAPAFRLKDADGRTVSLDDYKGKVVMLNFWATWCNPCKIEIPWFIEFERQNRDRGFAVLGLAMDNEGWEVVKPFIAESKMNYRVALVDEKTAQLYGGVEEIPTTYLIDREGRIAKTHVGLVSKSVYENDIRILLDQKAVLPSRPALRGVPAAVVGAR